MSNDAEYWVVVRNLDNVLLSKGSSMSANVVKEQEGARFVIIPLEVFRKPDLTLADLAPFDNY